MSIGLLDDHCFRHKEYLTTERDQYEIINSRDFLFDCIFEQQCSRELVFEQTVKDLLKSSINLSTENSLILYEKCSIINIANLLANTNI